MRAIPTGVAVAVVASVLVGGTATAQSVDQVNVRGQRVPNTKVVGRTSSGIPVEEITLNYDVSVAGIDPASNAGTAELAQRINAAAEAACKEISRRYPDATPGDAECARKAAGNAMVKARELVAAAHSR